MTRHFGRFAPLFTGILASFTIAGAGCDGSEVYRPILTGDVTIPDIEDDIDNDVDAITPEPTLDFQFQLKSGAVGRGVETVSLDPSDELDAYAAVAGFQTDIDFELAGDLAAGVARLLVGDNVLTQVPIDAAAVGTTSRNGLFRGITFPVSATPVTVRVEFTRNGTVIIASEKSVTTATEGPCVVVFEPERVPETECALISTIPTPNDAAAPRIRYTVRLESGSCDQLTGTITDPGGNVLVEINNPIGTATPFSGTVAFPADAEAIETVINFAFSAVHPSTPALNGRVEATITVDNVAPEPTFVAPSPATGSVIALDDDSDPNTAGIQFAIAGATTSADAVRATLAIGGVVSGEPLLLTGELGFAFPEATFSQDGSVAVAITVTDACGNVGTVETEARVVATPGGVLIASPAEGATLLARDDADRTTASIYETTFEVVVARAEPGSVVSVRCGPVDAAVEVGTFAIATPSSNGIYSVPVAIASPNIGTEIICTASVNGGTNTVPVALTLAIPAPVLTLTAPVSSEAAPVCFNTIGIPVSFQASGLDGREVAFTAADAAPGVVGTVAEGGLAGVVTLDAATADGLVAIGFDAIDTFGNVISELQTPVATLIRIDRQAPELLFDVPATATVDGDVEPDADPVAPGYQTRLAGTVTDGVVAGQVCTVGTGSVCTTIDSEGRWELFVRLQRGPNTIAVEATDDCNNKSPQVTRIITLERNLELVIVTPLNASNLLAAADGNPLTTTIYETSFGVTSRAAASGDVLTINCRQDAEGSIGIVVGSFVVPATPSVDGSYAIGTALPVNTIGQDIRCVALQSGSESNRSEEIALAVGLPAPSLVIATPAAGNCINDNRVAFSGTASGLEARTLSIAMSSLNSTTTIAAGVFSGLLDISGLADGGPFQVSFSANDRFGNPAAAAVAVTIDRLVPVISLVAPGVVIDPTISTDTSPAPGFQKDLVISVDDGGVPGTVVCVEHDGVALGCRTAAGSSVTFANTTLQPGQNAFIVSAVDACGNAAADLDFVVTLLTDPPIVRIVSPAADLVTPAMMVSLTAIVLEPGSSAVVLDGEARLLVDGLPSSVTATNNGDGTWTFADVPLTAGATASMVVEFTRNSATGASAPRSIRQKNVEPSIVIAAPANGPLALGSAFCTNSGPGCTGTVIATTTEVEGGSPARLSVDCAGVATSFPAVVTSGTARFPNITFNEGAACDLTVSVVDAARQEADSASVSVTVDRIAPSVAFVALPPIIQAMSDTAPVTPGIQTALAVSVSGAAAGSLVEVVFRWVENNAPQTKTVSATIVDGQTIYPLEEVPASGVVTWPEGVVGLIVTASDAVGNEGSASASVTVNSTATVAISAPTDTAASCTNTCTVGICHEGACWRGWGNGSSRLLSVNLAGMATATNNLRVCSDSPTLALSNAPLCASAAGPGGPYRQVLLQNGANGSNVLTVTTVLPVGYQRLIVESLPLSNGGWVTSLNAAVATARQRRIFLDLTAPGVTGVSSPSDTLEPPGYLNAAEQVSTPRVYTISFSTNEAGRADIVVNGIIVRTETVAAGSHSFTVTLPEGQPNVWVIVTDSVGNASPSTPGQGAVVYKPIVDVTPPTLAFTRPASSPLNASSNRDVVLTSNAEGRVVTVFDDGVQVGSGVINSGSVTIPNNVLNILSEGSHRLTAQVADVAGNLRTSVTTPAIVVVDTVPPAVTIVAPANNADLGDLDDAAPLAPGFQLDVRFGTSAGSSSWTIFTAANCDATFTTCNANNRRADGAVTNPGGNEPDVRLDAPITAQVSRFKVIVRVADAAGNTAEVAHNVTVTSNICQAVFTNLPPSVFFNATACANGTDCPSAALEIGAGSIGLCVANTIELRDGGVVLASSPVATFDGTFDISLADGVTVDLQVRLTLAGTPVASSPIETRTTDFTPPIVAFVAVDVDGFMTPADGASVVFNTATDLEPGMPGMQFNAALMLTDTNASGGVITSIGATDGLSSVQLSPFNISLPVVVSGTSPITTELRELVLADGATWTVTGAATDAAGNPGISTFTAQVDVTRPAAVQITEVVYEKRRPRLSPIAWVAVGDNGVGGTPVAEYIVKYSTQPIDEANWDDACDFADMYGSENMPAPATPGTAMSANPGGPDSRLDSDACKFAIRFETNEPAADPALHIVVRAVDTAGNFSPITSESTEILTNADVSLSTRRIRFDNSTGTLGFTPTSITVSGANLRDINGDDVADFGVGIALANAACIILGHDVAVSGETISAPAGINHNCLTPSIAATVIAGIDRVGDHVAALGDINGDGLADFGIVTRKPWTAPYEGNPNREMLFFIYLGADAAVAQDLAAPDVIIRGITAQSGTAGVGYVSACGVGDVNGSGPEDLAFGEPSLSRIHIIPGRSTWVKAGAGGPEIIDLAAAGAIAAQGGMTFTMTVAQGGPLFGGRCGRAGDVLPTPAGQGGADIGDILVAQIGFDFGRVFVLPGRVWTAGATETLTQYLTTPTAEDQRSLRLRQELTGQELDSVFGTDFQGAVDATGDGVPDILVGTSNRSLSAGRDGKSVYLFDGAGLADLVGTDVRINIGANPLVAGSWRGVNGWVLRSDLPARFGVLRFLPGFTGVSFGNPAFEPPHLLHANTNSDEIRLRANHEDIDSDYELGLFPVQDGDAFNNFTAGSISIGAWLTGGFDFTGDGALDIVTGTNFGEVLIIR